MNDWKTLLIPWIIFPLMKLAAGMRSWRKAIGGAALTSFVLAVAPAISAHFEVQLVFAGIVALVWFLVERYEERQQHKSV